MRMEDFMYCTKKGLSRVTLLLLILLYLTVRASYADQFQWKTGSDETERQFASSQALEYAKQVADEMSDEALIYSKATALTDSAGNKLWNCSFYALASESTLCLRSAVVFDDDKGIFLYQWDCENAIKADWEKEKGSFLTWDVTDQVLYDQLYASIIYADSKQDWVRFTFPEKNDMDTAIAIEYVKQFMTDTLNINSIPNDALWFACHETEFDTKTWQKTYHRWRIYCGIKTDKELKNRDGVVYKNEIPYIVIYNAIIDCASKEIIIILENNTENEDKPMKVIYSNQVSAITE